METLSLEDEDEELEVQVGDKQIEAIDSSLCLVGRFLTDRPIRIHMMIERKTEVWYPRQSVSIKEIDPNIFLFQFFHLIDVQRVLKHGPWSFDNHLLILGVTQEGETPSQITLFQVPYWMQVHNVLAGFMTEVVGQMLGNFIGEFLEYDAKNNSSFCKSYMHIKILISVRKHLKRLKKMKKAEGKAKEVRFKYERLNSLWYLYGMRGHIEDYCDKLFAMREDDGKRAWGPELMVDMKNSYGTGEARWLRADGQSTWMSPNKGSVSSHINEHENNTHGHVKRSENLLAAGPSKHVY